MDLVCSVIIENSYSSKSYLFYFCKLITEGNWPEDFISYYKGK